MVRGTKMKWKTVVMPNCQRERRSVIRHDETSSGRGHLGPKVLK